MQLRRLPASNRVGGPGFEGDRPTNSELLRRFQENRRVEPKSDDGSQLGAAKGIQQTVAALDPWPNELFELNLSIHH